jgi:hypothetical protein
MASVALGLEQVVGQRPVAFPAWWRQRHTYALGGITVLQIAGGRAAMHWIDAMPTSAWAGEAIIGTLLAQCFLLGLWGALGGLSTLPRWGTVGLIHTLGVMAMSLGLTGPWDGAWPQALVLCILGTMLVLAFAASLLPLRGLAGWRVDFDQVYCQGVRGRRGQISFMDYAGYSVGVAATLAAARLAIQADLLSADDMVTVIGLVVAVLLLAAPLTWLLIVSRWLSLAVLCVAVWPLMLAAGHSWLALTADGIDFLGGGSGYAWCGVRPHLTGFYYGAALLLASTLLPLRLFGLKLIVMPQPA